MTTAALALERPARLEAATTPEARGLARDEVRLMVSTPSGHRHHSFRDLPSVLPPGALLVANRSALIPASLGATLGRTPVLLNLSTRFGADLWLAEPRWGAERPGPLPIRPGERFEVAGLRAVALSPYPGIPRLWFVRFFGDVDAAVRTRGRPIRYGHLAIPYPGPDAYRTVFGDVPGSAELPSAGRPFTPRVLRALDAAGVHVASVTLHAGVSSLEFETDAIEDHTIPPEPYEVSAATAERVNAALERGRPVIAVGTTVVRALETARSGNRVRPSVGFTRISLHPGRRGPIVDGILTGFHDPLGSHLAMLHAVAGREIVTAAYDEALSGGYLWHELGDSHLILPAGVGERDPVARSKVGLLDRRRAG